MHSDADTFGSEFFRTVDLGQQYDTVSPLKFIHTFIEWHLLKRMNKCNERGILISRRAKLVEQGEMAKMHSRDEERKQSSGRGIVGQEKKKCYERSASSKT
jgi:hypothetical protein